MYIHLYTLVTYTLFRYVLCYCKSEGIPTQLHGTHIHIISQNFNLQEPINIYKIFSANKISMRFVYEIMKFYQIFNDNLALYQTNIICVLHAEFKRIFYWQGWQRTKENLWQQESYHDSGTLLESMVLATVLLRTIYCFSPGVPELS